MWFFIIKTLGSLLVAMFIGGVASWLWLGGKSAQIAEVNADREELEHDLGEANEMLDQRLEDINRLRTKLRRAATELEKRAGQVTTARRAHAEIQGRFAELQTQFTTAESERVRLQTLADDAIANPTLWAAEAESRDIEAAVTERTAAFETKVSELESTNAVLQEDLRSAQAAASEADSDLNELRERIDRTDEELVRVRAEGEQERTDLNARIVQLENDLSSARSRSESARLEVSEIAASLGEYRDQNALQLQDTHAKLAELYARVHTAHSLLGGVPASPSSQMVAHSSGLSSAQFEPGSPNELLSLPGMNDQLAELLAGLSVSSLDDIAAWSPADVEHYESWMPDFPQVISSNEWVTHARRVVDGRAAAIGSK